MTLDPGQTTTVRFTLNATDVGFYDDRGSFRVEPGRIDVFAGDTSGETDNTDSFTVTG